MSNIQQSVNSILTTGAALKALGEKRELKKAEEEKAEAKKKAEEERRKAEEELRKQKEEHEKEIKRGKDYIDALLGQKTTGKIDPTEEVEKTKEKVVSKRIIKDYNVNEEFNLAEESARSFLDESLGSFDSFMGEYNNRKSNGGNK